jgi:hypothetical protein
MSCVSNITQVLAAPDVPASHWFGKGPTYYGPFEYASNLYIAQIINLTTSGLQPDEPEYDIQILKSTNGGLTWAIIAILSHPEIDFFAEQRCQFFISGSIIYYAYLRNTSTFSQINIDLGKYDIVANAFSHSFSTLGPHVANLADIPTFDQMSISRQAFDACIVGGVIYVGYANTESDPTPAFAGLTYYYTKCAVAKYVIATDTWTEVLPYAQTGTVVYTFFSIIPGDGCLHTFLFHHTLNPLFPNTPPQITEALVHYSLDYDLNLLSSETIHTNINLVENLDHPKPITFLDGGTKRIAVGVFEETYHVSSPHIFSSPYFKIFEGANASVPSFSLARTLNVSEVDPNIESVFGIIVGSQYQVSNSAIYWTGTNYSVFVDTLTEGGSSTFSSKLWKVDYTGSAWEACEILNTQDVNTSTSWVQVGVGVYIGTSYGDFISWGLADRDDFAPEGYFYTALIAASINLSVSVSDTLVFADHVTVPVPSTPGGGTEVHNCPDVIISSAYCSSVKTAVDDEAQLHNCDEEVFTETAQPCLEMD